MSEFIITATQDCGKWELDSLTLTTEIRTAADDVDEYRKVLHVELHEKIDSMQSLEVQEMTVSTEATLEPVTISGGPVFDPILCPGTNFSSFFLQNQELTPYKEQGCGLVELKTDWVAKTIVDEEDPDSAWEEIDWTGADVEPEHEVYSNVAATTYTSCYSQESTSVFNDYRDNGEEEYRTRVAIIQYYDTDNITSIQKLENTLYRLPSWSLPSVGYNDGNSIPLTVSLLVTDRKFILTEFQVVPISEYGGTMARVKYKWELWGEWLPMYNS